jgi:uncharacterized protein
MKKQKSNSMKVAASILLTTTMVILSSCNTKQANTSGEDNPTTVAEKAPEPPAMDIHTATYMGSLDAIHQHILAGSDLNKKDDYGSTPLITAALFGKNDVALALIEGGADLNSTNADGSTALHTAAFFGRTEIVKALIEKGADKNVRNKYGSTPLESVAGPFSEVKAIYDQISKDLGPLGLKLDYTQLEKSRSQIAEILR